MALYQPFDRTIAQRKSSVIYASTTSLADRMADGLKASKLQSSNAAGRAGPSRKKGYDPLRIDRQEASVGGGKSVISTAVKKRNKEKKNRGRKGVMPHPRENKTKSMYQNPTASPQALSIYIEYGVPTDVPIRGTSTTQDYNYDKGYKAEAYKPERVKKPVSKNGKNKGMLNGVVVDPLAKIYFSSSGNYAGSVGNGRRGKSDISNDRSYGAGTISGIDSCIVVDYFGNERGGGGGNGSRVNAGRISRVGEGEGYSGGGGLTANDGGASGYRGVTSVIVGDDGANGGSYALVFGGDSFSAYTLTGEGVDHLLALSLVGNATYNSVPYRGFHTTLPFSGAKAITVNNPYEANRSVVSLEAEVDEWQHKQMEEPWMKEGWERKRDESIDTFTGWNGRRLAA